MSDTTIYDENWAFQESQLAPTWKPEGGMFETAEEDLQNNGGEILFDKEDYLIRPLSQADRLSVSNLMTLTTNTDKGADLRLAVAEDQAERNLEADIENMDDDLREEGRTLVTRAGWADFLADRHEGWMKPGMSLSQTLDTIRESEESLQSIKRGEGGDLQIITADHDGDTLFRCRSATPEQAERIKNYLNQGEEGKADALWNKLPAPNFPSYGWDKPADRSCPTPVDALKQPGMGVE